MSESPIVMPILISFFISILTGPILIFLLKRLKIAQTVREDGPKTHLQKMGTPTMGGIMILVSVIFTALIYIEKYPKIFPVLFLMFGFGLIGFFDDFIKVILRRPMGLSPLQKLCGQLLVTGIFAYYMVHFSGISLAMKIPFGGGMYIDFGRWNIPVMFLVILGTANGTNFTDGLDGLLSGVTVPVVTFFSVVAWGLSVGIYPITCAVLGALFGFLLFNVHPASVFMGDTGSLALGGFLAATAYMLQMPLFLVIVGFIYMAEVLSVMLQVAYFKLSGGKRLFKMAPLHHHFELCGYSESKIVTLFTIVTALLCLAALFAL